MSYNRGFQSIQGPTDPVLRHSEIEGYQPVSRIGEVVINSFVDSFEHSALAPHITANKVDSSAPAKDAQGRDIIFEYKPHFHEWATALPGMICVSRKARNATFRGNYAAAETATPVITSCAVPGRGRHEGLTLTLTLTVTLTKPNLTLILTLFQNFYFAGVCRSKSVRPIDDGVGPSVDEFFTLAIGGMVTLLNNSGGAVFPGDFLEWTFYNENSSSKGRQINDATQVPGKGSGVVRGNNYPRRIAVKIASASSERVIGRCLSFAKSGETFDLMLKAC